MKIKICCEDMKITHIDYKHITFDGIYIDNIRFTGHVITYCPFCGKKIEVE